MTKRGRPPRVAGEIPEPTVRLFRKNGVAVAGVHVARVVFDDYNGVEHDISRKSPVAKDRAGRWLPDRNGERARRAVLDAAERLNAVSAGTAGDLTPQSDMRAGWTAYRSHLVDQGRSEGTFTIYDPYAATILETWGSRAIGTVNTPVIESMAKRLGERHGRSGAEKGTDSLLSGMFRYFCRIGVLDTNPVSAAKVPQNIAPLRRTGGAAYVTPDTMRDVLTAVFESGRPCPPLVDRPRAGKVPTVAEYCETTDLAFWVLVEMMTGLRISQSLGLRERDISFTATRTAPWGRLRPVGAIKRRRPGSRPAGHSPHGWVDSTPQTSGGATDPKNSQQEIALPRFAQPVFEARFKWLRKQRLSFEPRPADANWPEDLLFPTISRGNRRQIPRGAPRNLTTVSGQWLRVAKALELPEGFSSHSFRKFMLSEGQEHGLGVAALADVAGHASTAMIGSNYTDRFRGHPEVARWVDELWGQQIVHLGGRRTI